MRFCTIGHSTRTIEDFVELLRLADVRLIVDVRSIPRSRTNPQYNSSELATTLSELQIGYEHSAALGGLRKKQHDVPAEVNGFWKHPGFHNFADYALTDDFRAGLTRLRELGAVTPCAVLCAEAVWWRCHRRIIADYLIAAGETVFHVLAPGNIRPAQMTEGAKPEGADRITYPAEAGE